MTKRVLPLTEADAIAQITAALPGGIAQAAQLVGRDPSTVYRWGNPDTDDSTPVSCAIILERAYREAGGIGSPFGEYMAAVASLADAQAIAENIEVHRLAIEINRSAGNANAEIGELALPGATDKDWREAAEATETLLQKLTRIVPLLKRGPRLPDQQQQPP
jgi:uncharacterized protein YdbL (DUF1318 family)